MNSSNRSTIYKIKLITPAEQDFAGLDHSLRQRAYQQLEKLQRHPYAGAPCGNKQGLDLTGFYSLHFLKNKYRIVYEILEEQGLVRVWGIGKRDKTTIYKMIASRVSDVSFELAEGLLSISEKAKLKPPPKKRKPQADR